MSSDESCKWCGECHERVPEDLCAWARREYDNAGVILEAAWDERLGALMEEVTCLRGE